MKILLLIILLLSTLSPTFAQEDTKLDELKNNSEVLAEEIDELNEKEDERVSEKANLLGISLPEYTDNPSYVITFKDTSEKGVGVEIELDDKDFTKITSPYTFPALSIGKHNMRFRFTDENGQVQILEHSLIIIPRPPIISSPTINEDFIKIEGTALSNSEIIYTLTNNAFNDSELITTDESGYWSITFSPESGLSDGIYTFNAYTRKYGYASNLSKSVVFAVGDANKEILEKDPETDRINFSFVDLKTEDLDNIFTEHRDLLILVLVSFIFGGALAIIFRVIFVGRSKNRKIKEQEELISNQKSNTKGSEKTLRELFEGGDEDKKVKEEEVKEPKKSKKEKRAEKKKEKEQKKAQIINKDVFLRDFKHMDPDDNKGQEKEIKKIKVSLTSNEESE